MGIRKAHRKLQGERRACLKDLRIPGNASAHQDSNPLSLTGKKERFAFWQLDSLFPSGLLYKVDF